MNTSNASLGTASPPPRRPSPGRERPTVPARSVPRWAVLVLLRADFRTTAATGGSVTRTASTAVERSGGSQVRRKEVQVKLTIPFVGEVSGTWVPDDAERQAAWELYVELTTRIAVVPLGPNEGLLREALSS